MVSQAVQQWEDVIHCHGDLGAVQLQQAPQVPVAARPRHARGHCRRPEQPVRSSLIHLGRGTRNLTAARLISVGSRNLNPCPAPQPRAGGQAPPQLREAAASMGSAVPLGKDTQPVGTTPA